MIDALAPAALQAAAWAVCEGKTWYFGNRSTDEHAVPFWKMDLDGVAAFDAIWEAVRARCEALAGASLKVVRQYANGHTYGLGGQPHHDDHRPGTFTLLYYPMPEWQAHWDGETVFLDGEGEVALAVRPKPNRAVLFDSRIPHAGRAPSRSFTGLRVTVAFKLEALQEAEAGGADPIRVEEISRDGVVSEFSLRIAASEVDRRVTERLHALGESLRLPGFRPGKIPKPVLEQRYGSRARSEVVQALIGEFGPRTLAEGAMLSGWKLEQGAAEGDVVFDVTVTRLRDLPAPDLSRLTLDRGDESADVKQQILDRLAEIYDFPVAPQLIERELAAIWKSAESRLDLASENREELGAEFREIAERRVRLGIVVGELARRNQIPLTDPGQVEARVIDWILSQAG